MQKKAKSTIEDQAANFSERMTYDEWRALRSHLIDIYKAMKDAGYVETRAREGKNSNRTKPVKDKSSTHGHKKTD